MQDPQVWPWLTPCSLKQVSSVWATWAYLSHVERKSQSETVLTGRVSSSVNLGRWGQAVGWVGGASVSGLCRYLCFLLAPVWDK